MTNIDWGSVADWSAAIATTAASVLALWLARRAEVVRKREIREQSYSQAKYLMAAAEILQAQVAVFRSSLIAQQSVSLNWARHFNESTSRLPVSALNAAAHGGFVFEGTVPGNIVGTILAVEHLRHSAEELVTCITEFDDLLRDASSAAPNSSILETVRSDREKNLASHAMALRHQAALTQSWVNGLISDLQGTYLLRSTGFEAAALTEEEKSFLS